MNCRPCLPFPFTDVLGVACSSTGCAAGALEPFFSGSNVNGLRLLIDISSTFSCFHVYSFARLQRQSFRQPSKQDSDLGGGAALGVIFLRGAAIIHGMGKRHEVMQ